jgi:hypothetical protein
MFRFAKFAVFAAIALTLVQSVSAAIVVSDNFEGSVLGNLNGQVPPVTVGTTPWTSTQTVVNTGPRIGNQAVFATTSNLAAGAFSYHSWVDLVASGNFSIPAGSTLNASVSVFVDGNDTTGSVGGIGGWANTGANTNGVLGVGNNLIVFRNGTGTPASTIALPSSITGLTINTNGWNELSLQVTQVAPDTVTTTYRVNGFQLPGISHTRVIAGGNGVSDFDLFNLNTTSVAATVSNRFDNYLVELTAVPEPTSLGLVAGAMVLGVRLRRLRNKGNLDMG